MKNHHEHTFHGNLAPSTAVTGRGEELDAATVGRRAGERNWTQRQSVVGPNRSSEGAEALHQATAVVTARGGLSETLAAAGASPAPGALGGRYFRPSVTPRTPQSPAVLIAFRLISGCAKASQMRRPS